MQRIKFKLSYDGTDFCGWQKQKDHAMKPDRPSLQETLEQALQKLFRQPISLSASGRTDAGVHAVAQIAHFDTDRPLPKDFCWAMRSLLPSTIAVQQAWIAPSEFHSTLSAEKKTYKYWVWNGDRPSALLSRYSYWVRKPLDLDLLNQYSQALIGQHDFKSFQSVGTPVKTTVRHIYQAKWKRKNSKLIEFEVTGNGFLKQMVRNLVGTQIDFHLKDQPVERISQVLSSLDRQKAGPTAPPQGLFLFRVYYPKALDNKCRQI